MAHDVGVRRRGAIVACPLVLALIAAGSAAPLVRAETPTREEAISFESADRVRLEGVLLLPDPPTTPGQSLARWPLAILVHAFNRTRDSLLPLADALAGRGFACLLMDLRGHGMSVKYKGTAIYSLQVRRPQEIHLAVDDQKVALEVLQGRKDLDLDRVAMVGVGGGALIAAETAARTPGVRALVLVDPIRANSGFNTEDDLGLFGSRPVLLIPSAYPQSKTVSQLLAGFGSGERRTIESETFETMDRLLPEGSPLLAQIGEWLTEKVNPPARGAPNP